MRNNIANSGTGYARLGRFACTVSALALIAGAPEVTKAEDAANSDAAIEEIVVSGLKYGLENSINLKKSEVSIVEAISAEDIGKLPDVSIAESIARLPGLAAQRVNGRAQVISIRGLAPDFTTTLLNGRQQASSGDNRAVEFDQYPSELLAGVVIYKTPDAQISGMGLSGTADMRTVRPLDIKKRVISVNVRGEINGGGKLNSDVKNYGNRISASYIDKFANDTLGIAIGVSHLDSPSQTKHFKAYGYEGFGFAVTPDSADPAMILNGQEVFAYSRENKRDAVMGTVEWKPSEKVHSTLDLYYSRFKQRETMRGAQWFSNGWADNATFTNVQTEQRGGSMFAVSGDVHNVVPQLRNDYNKRDDKLFSAGLNNEFQASDRLKLIADLSYSKNTRDEQILETYAGYGLGVGGVTGSTQNVGRTLDNISFALPDNGFPTYSEGLNYADAAHVSLGDRAPWGGWGHDGAIRFPHVKEEIYSADLKAKYEIGGFFNSVDMGINYTHREKSKRVNDYDLFLKNGRQQILVAPQYLVNPTSLGFAGFGNVISVNLPDALGNYYNQSPILDANYFDKNWDITEKVTTFYGKVNIEEGNLRGNVGVQVVHQTQESTGVIIQGSPIVPLPVSESYSRTDFLPNLNLVYDLGSGHHVRFAASKTMARPRMDDMRANITPSFGLPNQPPAPGSTLHPWGGSGGNPNLKPWKATAFDLSYEWYINKTSYLSIAGFYKKLDTYIYQQSLPFDFTGVPIPTGASIPPGVIISPIGQMTLPANGKGGSIKGLEFSGAFNFGTISKDLDGFGLIGSLSLTKSNLNPTSNPNPVQEVRIPGLSGTIYNLTAYYEKNGFNARISQRYRSAFKGEVVQLYATRGFTEIMADRQVDAQIGYTFPEGSRLEGLGMLFQVNNLTNSAYRTRLGLDNGGTKTSDGSFLPETYEKYGRQFLFGFNYRL